jgi:hypothetical protein
MIGSTPSHLCGKSTYRLRRPSERVLDCEFNSDIN